MRFRDELRRVMALRHPRIELIMGICVRSPDPAIVCENLKGMPLHRLLHVIRARLDSRDVVDITKQLSGAMAFAHSRQMLHLALQSRSIHITEAKSVKVCDWGCAAATSILQAKCKAHEGLPVAHRWGGARVDGAAAAAPVA